MNYEEEGLLNHAYPHISSEELYNFYIVTFEDNMCPAHIYGFSKKGLAVVQQKIVENEGITIEENDNNLFVNTTYMLVHISTE